jgi:hypothetical protein
MLRVYYEYQHRFGIVLLSCFLIWIILSVLFSMFTLVIFTFFNQNPNWIFFCIPIGLALVGTVVFSFSTRLVTHEDVLEYHRIFEHIISPWEDLSHFEVVVKMVSDEGSISQSPHYTYYLCLKGNDSKKLNISSIVPIRQVPYESGYSIDVHHLLRTPFGKDLDQYAPHVIEAALKVENHAIAS